MTAWLRVASIKNYQYIIIYYYKHSKVGATEYNSIHIVQKYKLVYSYRIEFE